MKEIRFAIKQLLNRRELYFSIIIVFLVNLLHVILVLRYESNWQSPIEFSRTAEYQFVLHNLAVTLNPIIIIIFPILLSLILADSYWIEKNSDVTNNLHLRLNIKKLIVIRWLLSIITSFLVSFAGFMLNYLSLSFVFGNGNASDYSDSMAFYLNANADHFLDRVRFATPQLYAVLICVHVASLLGLLSGVSFMLSLYTKNRIIIFFEVPILIIALEAVLSVFSLSDYSILRQLQVGFTSVQPKHALILSAFLFLISVFGVIHKVRNRDLFL